MTSRRLLLPLLFLVLLAASHAFASETSVGTTWRLLDYIAVDYRGAVRDGAIVNQAEYEEMLEFAATAATAIDALPPTAGSDQLKGLAEGLQRGIRDKEAAEQIATRARALAALLVQHHPIALVPDSPPPVERGRVLYAQLCASCHGANGAADGPASAGLDPAPIDFTDRARASERSVFALYQVIGQGLEGTSMPSYASLPAEDRWALAFHVGGLAYPQAIADQGRTLLADEAMRKRFDLARVVGEAPARLAVEFGPERAEAITAFLRRHPDAIDPVDADASLATARGLLRRSMSAYRSGDANAAKDLALAAYLDGFEPVEPLLVARDRALMASIEAAMARVRGGIASRLGADALQHEVDALDGLFTRAELVLSRDDASSMSSFVAAFTILLREGLEALLIVVGVVALLHKAERTEMLRWVHGGWLSALGAGAITWILATWVITISGASRELTEGFGSLLAAAVLAWVGIWMHGKSRADAWQRHIRERLSRALGRRSGWFLLGLVFVVVYREVFETILFYAAIWNEGSRGSVIAGGASAVLTLALIGAAMMRYSRRLPIGQFFRASAWLIAVLTVALTGKAVSALQEAGMLPVSWVEHAPSIELLGIHPTLQGLAAQLAIAAVLILGFMLAGRQARPG